MGRKIISHESNGLYGTIESRSPINCGFTVAERCVGVASVGSAAGFRIQILKVAIALDLYGFGFTAVLDESA